MRFWCAGFQNAGINAALHVTYSLPEECMESDSRRFFIKSSQAPKQDAMLSHAIAVTYKRVRPVAISCGCVQTGKFARGEQHILKAGVASAHACSRRNRQSKVFSA